MKKGKIIVLGALGIMFADTWGTLPNQNNGANAVNQQQNVNVLPMLTSEQSTVISGYIGQNTATYVDLVNMFRNLNASNESLAGLAGPNEVVTFIRANWGAIFPMIVEDAGWSYADLRNMGIQI